MLETVAPDTFLPNSLGPSLKSSPRSTADLSEWRRAPPDPELYSLIERAIAVIEGKQGLRRRGTSS